jgi:hypothetical protein
MGLLDPIFGGGTDTSALQRNSDKADNFLKDGKQGGLKVLKKGQRQYTPLYNEAANAFDPYNQMGQQLNSLYTDATGANGQAGYDNAVGSFHQGPGFQFGLDAANQNIMRNAASLGGLASGGTFNALGAEAQGRQNQEYQQWMDNLFRGSAQGLQGAAGFSQAKQGLGGQIANTAAQKADVHTGAAGARATNASSLGAGLQSQTAADQASQLSLLQSILGGAAKVGGAYFSPTGTA